MNEKMWLKRVLIPFWTIELLWCLVILIISAVFLGQLRKLDAGYNSLSSILLIAFTGVTIILDAVNIGFFAKHKLRPATFLTLCVIKAIFWVFIFVLDIIDAAGTYRETGLAFLFSAVLFATSVGQVAYGAVIVHRKRKGTYSRGYYAGVTGAAGATGYRAGGYESPPRGSYAGYNPHGAPPNPFRDPSREPSPEPSARVPLVTPPSQTSGLAPLSLAAKHPAMRQSGEAEAYYDSEAAKQSFEMQGSAYRDN